MKRLLQIQEILRSLPDDILSPELREDLKKNLDRVQKEYRYLEQKCERAIREKEVVHSLLQRASDDLIKQYRVLFEYSGIPMVMLDERGEIIRANSQFYNFSSISREESEHPVSFLDLVWKEDRDKIERYHTKTRLQENVPSAFEVRIKTPDGGCRFVSLSIGLLPGGQDSVVSLLDVTEKWKRRAELTAHNERLSALLSLYQMTGQLESDITAFALRKGIELTASSLGLLGFLDNETRHLTIAATCSSESKELNADIHLTRLSLPLEELPRISEAIHLQKSLVFNEIPEEQQFIPMIFNEVIKVDRLLIVPIIEQERVVAVGCVANKKGLYEDADNLQLSVLFAGMWRLVVRNRQEEVLRTMNNKLSLLSSLTRHDILNLLTALEGYLGLSQDEDLDPEVSHYIKKALDAVHGIEDIIAFTREYESVGVNSPVWQQVSMAFSDAIPQDEIPRGTIVSRVEGLWIYADPLLSRVFANFIDNSFRHGGTVHTIQLTCDQNGDDLLLIYSDDGAGVDPKEKEKIFLRGYGKHTGLGLFLIREILAITGITIKENGISGEGIRFEMTIPRGNYRLLQATVTSGQTSDIRHLEG